ncbi:MAG: type II secretion system F family protein [Comamonas sp.]|nr:type II secretion system F family protein [Comamonas sp.]
MSNLGWISMACLLLAAGIGLWGYAQHKQNVQVISQRVQRVLDAEPTLVLPVALDKERQQRQHEWLQFAPPWVQQAFSPRQWVLIALSTGCVTGLVAWMSSLSIAVIVPLLVLGIALFVAWLRWQRLRARVVQQLPSFIDGMVRMVVLGHATQSAFVMATAAAKEPLASIVVKAAAFAKAGMPIDQALQAATRELKLNEFNLLAAILHVGGRFGGRVDHLLERVAHLMRDREQADRELKALSAEVRVSAWVLSLLPVVVGGVIIVLNASYFMKMWDDPSGKWLALVSLGLQVMGSVVLYRLASLDD